MKSLLFTLVLIALMFGNSVAADRQLAKYALKGKRQFNPVVLQGTAFQPCNTQREYTWFNGVTYAEYLRVDFCNLKFGKTYSLDVSYDDSDYNSIRTFTIDLVGTHGFYIFLGEVGVLDGTSTNVAPYVFATQIPPR